MNRPEILAPAGSMESLLAALHCGADAVYAGGKAFSARARAENFDRDALEEAVKLCHLHGAKLYLTVNTLVTDAEFPAMEAWLREAVSCGIDAVLVQDLGVLQTIREMAPTLPIHASTQMTIHTPEGARWAKAHGISRVVAARELSRSELQAICQTGIEVEVFVHGALCMSVSGQCGLSAVIGSRSANRGCCAGACRLPFSATGKQNAYALSLKDLCLIPHLQELQEIGVSSLKIEGRVKRPEYVAAAVTALRQAQAGKTPDLQTLRAVFSRSGFTDGYFTGKRQQMFGVRQKEDVLQMQTVLPQLKELSKKPAVRVPLQMQVQLKHAIPVQLTATDPEGNFVTVLGNVPEPAKTKPADAAFLERQLKKLGDSIYLLETLHAECDGISTLSAASLNALRRKCTAEMDAVRIQQHTPKIPLRQLDFLPELSQKQAGVPPHYRILLPKWSATAETLLQHPRTEVILLPLSMADAAIPERCRSRIQLLLPRFCPNEAKLFQQLQQAKAMGFSAVCCGNVAHIRMGARLGFQLHGGMGLNLMNSRSLQLCRQEGLQDGLLSPELTISQAKGCTGLPVGVYAYGNQPVMLMRNCPIREEAGCARCHHALTDRTGRKFPIFCDRFSGTATLYNAVPTWMADRQHELAFCSYLLLDCTCAPDPAAILQAYEQSASTTCPITRGLFFRGVE